MKKIIQISEYIPDEWEIGIHISKGKVKVSLMNPNGGFIDGADKFANGTLEERLNIVLSLSKELNTQYLLHDKFEA